MIVDSLACCQPLGRHAPIKQNIDIIVSDEIALPQRGSERYSGAGDPIPGLADPAPSFFVFM
jgi:hypothetical protein